MKFVSEGMQVYRWKSGSDPNFTVHGLGEPIRCIVVVAAGRTARVRDLDDPKSDRWISVDDLK